MKVPILAEHILQDGNTSKCVLKSADNISFSKLWPYSCTICTLFILIFGEGRGCLTFSRMCLWIRRGRWPSNLSQNVSMERKVALQLIVSTEREREVALQLNVSTERERERDMALQPFLECHYREGGGPLECLYWEEEGGGPLAFTTSLESMKYLWNPAQLHTQLPGFSCYRS